MIELYNYNFLPHLYQLTKKKGVHVKFIGKIKQPEYIKLLNNHKIEPTNKNQFIFSYK